MRFLIYIILLLSLPMFVFGNEDDLPHKDFKIKQTYKLDNGNTILIEHTGMNNAIWEKDFITGKFNKISIDNENLRMYCERMNIKLIRSIVRGCKQRELKQIEKDYNRKLETV